MSRQIFLFSGIDDYSAQSIISKLLELDRQSNDEITIFINSPGGYVTSMFAIIDVMDLIKSPIRTVVIGVAASAASVIASAGDIRLISQGSEIMLHEVSSGTWGKVSDQRDDIKRADMLNDRLFARLAQNTRKSIDDVKNKVGSKDVYFSAEEAFSFGLVDKIMEKEEAQALKLSESINVEGFEINAASKEIQLLRTGSYEHPVYGKFFIDEKILNLLKSNFDSNVRGQEISIDYTHDNDDGESPAAFWIKSLEIRENSDGKGKGLFARGEFTPMGEKKVSEKEYKYSSADFVIDYMDHNGKHHPYVLRGGTLTNRPFIKEMDPIKLSEPTSKKKEAKDMNKDELIATLKTEHSVDIVALEGAARRVKELEASIAELKALPAQKEEEVKALQAKLDEINAKIVSDEKERAFDELVAQGKAVPAQKDKVLSAFKDAEAMCEFYKDAPSIIKTSATGGDDDPSMTDGLSEAEALLVKEGKYTKEQIIENRSI